MLRELAAADAPFSHYQIAKHEDQGKRDAKEQKEWDTALAKLNRWKSLVKAEEEKRDAERAAAAAKKAEQKAENAEMVASQNAENERRAHMGLPPMTGPEFGMPHIGPDFANAAMY